VTDHRLGAQDAGRTIEVAAGDRLVVALPASSGAGYVWEVEELPEGAELLDERYERPAPGIGGANMQVFVLTAGEGGTLRLRHTRPWLGEGGVLERYEVAIAPASPTGPARAP
jgi:predicted secreted protein